MDDVGDANHSACVRAVFNGNMTVTLETMDAVLERVQGEISTWLILPVVIRSSQRLSHACLSINNLL